MNSPSCLCLKRVVTAIALAHACIAANAYAQSAANYPTRAMRWIVGYTPGGTADMMARAVGAKFTEAWGHAVIVENRPGGATNIATELVAKSAPDGYTLLLGTVANVINPSLYAKMPFDFQDRKSVV